jgi:hypothetical protein
MLLARIFSDGVATRGGVGAGIFPPSTNVVEGHAEDLGEVVANPLLTGG